MSNPTREHLERVRERFTRTAQQFASFSLTKRSEEAERLVQLTQPRGDELALDVACGPGTFARAFGSHVKLIWGVDLTPAFLGQARAAAAQAGLTNAVFLCGEASALPFDNGSLDLVVCGYSLHHFAEVERVVREMARVLHCDARAAVGDLIAPDDPARAGANNRIERARDASHARTLAAREILALFESSGFRVQAHEIGERWRSFDDWMQIAGWKRGDPAYQETRRLMEVSMEGDTAGFRPRFKPLSEGLEPDLEFLQTSLFVVAEKS